MNYAIIFSTYNNKTKTTTPLSQLESDLKTLAQSHKLQGFSLSDQIGYWAGEYETSYILTVFDIAKHQAFDIARAINRLYNQDASIVKPIKEQVYFINREGV